MAPRTRQTRRKQSRAMKMESSSNGGTAKSIASRNVKTKAKPSTDFIDGRQPPPPTTTTTTTTAKTTKEGETTAVLEEDPACPPDCKCLLRGRGFFLPFGMEDETGAKEGDNDRS